MMEIYKLSEMWYFAKDSEACMLISCLLCNAVLTCFHLHLQYDPINKLNILCDFT